MSIRVSLTGKLACSIQESKYTHNTWQGREAGCPVGQAHQHMARERGRVSCRTGTQKHMHGHIVYSNTTLQGFIEGTGTRRPLHSKHACESIPYGKGSTKLECYLGKRSSIKNILQSSLFITYPPSTQYSRTSQLRTVMLTQCQS